MIPDAIMKVTRADGTLEFDSGTDAYSILCEQARAGIASLGKLDKGRMHTRDVYACMVTIKNDRAQGVELTPTVAVPVDPELGGALIFGALMATREHSPAAFAVALRRLRDAGALNSPPLVSR